MYVMVALSLAFYALWVIDVQQKDVLVVTIPLATFILIRYSFIIEKDSSDGDPSEVLLSDRVILFLGIVFTVLILMGIYL
ncbi:phosphoribose diphosphate:decaprenyl-phosphate phosphoribosyltransferase [compost metagenome]